MSCRGEQDAGARQDLEDASNELPALDRLAVQRSRLLRIEIECDISGCDQRIAAQVHNDAQAETTAQLCGFGLVTASALVASVGDRTHLETSAQFGAWLGLVASQNSSCGKASLGHTTEPATITCARC